MSILQMILITHSQAKYVELIIYRIFSNWLLGYEMKFYSAYKKK